MASLPERGWSREITRPAATRNDLASAALAAGRGPHRLLAALGSPGIEQQRWRRGMRCSGHGLCTWDEGWPWARCKGAGAGSIPSGEAEPQ